jgi:hypothetical protein
VAAVSLLDPGTLLLVAVFALLLSGAFAPLEALGWWAGWYCDRADEEPPPANGEVAGFEPARSGVARRFVVFLSGIDSVTDEPTPARQVRFLARLREAVPDAVVLHVFPYSVTNRALTGERTFARFWRWALRQKLGTRRHAQIAGMIINARNTWQVLVSADRRYGPFYDRGSAALLARQLRRAGYRDGSRLPVVLIGYSGGGQIAVGATPFLRDALGAPVTVLSLGGVLSADPGLLAVEHLVHVIGSGDGVHKAGAVMFPGRWPVFPYSPWNEARKRGLIRTLVIGPCDHTGDNGYLDDNQRVADGRSYFDVTVDVMAALIRDPTGPAPVADPTPAAA